MISFKTFLENLTHICSLQKKTGCLGTPRSLSWLLGFAFRAGRLVTSPQGHERGLGAAPEVPSAQRAAALSSGAHEGEVQLGRSTGAAKEGFDEETIHSTGLRFF